MEKIIEVPLNFEKIIKLMNLNELRFINDCFENEVFISGGCIRDMFHAIPFKDIDLFSIVNNTNHDVVIKNIEKLKKYSRILRTVNLDPKKDPDKNFVCFKAYKLDIIIFFNQIESNITPLEFIENWDFTLNKSCATLNNINDGFFQIYQHNFVDLQQKKIILSENSIFINKPNRLVKRYNRLLEKGYIPEIETQSKIEILKALN
jgi:hypothetical protein